MPYEYIVFDIDGTLLPKAKKPEDSEYLNRIVAIMNTATIDRFREVVQTARENGVKLIIATGRPAWFSTQVGELLFDGNVHAYICQQGWEVLQNGESRISRQATDAWRLHFEKTLCTMKDLVAEDDFVYANGFSCGVISKNEARLNQYRASLKHLINQVAVIRSMAETVYLTHREVTKLTALRHVIGNARYAFIGDSMNDYEAMVDPQCVRIGLPANANQLLRSQLCQEHMTPEGKRYFPKDRAWHAHRLHENLAGTTELLERILRQDLGITF